MVKAGDRVEMTGIMRDEPSPIPIGTRGTVTETNMQFKQIYVDWDPDARGVRRTLILLTTDPFRVIERAE